MDKDLFFNGPLNDITITFQNDPSQKVIIRSPFISDCHIRYEDIIAYGGRNNSARIQFSKARPLTLELSAESMELLIDKTDHSNKQDEVFAQPDEEGGLSDSQNEFDSGYFLDENLDFDYDLKFNSDLDF